MLRVEDVTVRFDGGAALDDASLEVGKGEVMSSSASATVFPGASVTGSTIIPDSERFTLSTSAT